MSRINFVLLSLIIVLTLGASDLLAVTTLTYAVGTCKPSLPSFSTISAALVATPAPNVVLVCPGTYPEQIVITQAVTLQGVSNGDSDQAVIVPLSGGLTNTAADDLGDTLFYQVWVNNASGPVNLSKLTIDGTGNGVTSACYPFVVGVFLQNSAGTVSSVATRNQKGNGCGFGFYVEGGASNPSVTIQNSSIHDYDFAGIQTETNSATSEVTATITGNDVTCAFTGIDFCGGILLEAGTTDTVTGNFISSTNTGISALPSVTGSISRNTVVNVVNGGGVGIFTAADAVSVTSNKIINTDSNNSSIGISLFTSVATVQGNVITNANAGIGFNCTANPNVHSNTIMDAASGVVNVPSAINTTNSYANVGTIRSGC
jgi:hypothetical protein